MNQKNSQLFILVVIFIILILIVGGAIYLIKVSQQKVAELNQKAKEAYQALINNNINSNGNLNISLGVGEVVLTIKLNQFKCEPTDTYALFDILANSEKVGEVKVGNCESRTGEVLAQTKDKIYFTILPGGIGGYILYGKYNNLYQYTTADNKITNILSLTDITDFDFTSDRQKLVYIETPNEPTNPRPLSYALVIRDLTNGIEQSYSLSGDYTRYGDVKFSPLNDQVAFAGGAGPEPEKSAVFILNITSLNNTPQLIASQDGKIFHVTGWKNNEEVIYE